MHARALPFPAGCIYICSAYLACASASSFSLATSHRLSTGRLDFRHVREMFRSQSLFQRQHGYAAAAYYYSCPSHKLRCGFSNYASPSLVRSSISRYSFACAMASKLLSLNEVMDGHDGSDFEDDSDDNFDGYLDMDEEQRNEGESGRGAT